MSPDVDYQEAWDGHTTPDFSEKIDKHGSLLNSLLRTATTHDTTALSTAIEYLEACKGHSVADVKLATAYRYDVQTWEQLMWKLLGVDGKKSVEKKILALQKEIKDLKKK